MSSSVAPTESANPIRLLLVDDKLLVRDGLRALLEEQSGFEVVGQVASLAETAALAESMAVDAQPDVVITDLVLPDSSGGDLVKNLHRVFARAAIFVLTDTDRQDQVETLVSAGVDGYLLKNASTAEFLSGVRSVAQGVRYLHPAIVVPRSEVTTETDETGDTGTVGLLSAKEREVLQLLVLGHTNAEIASLCAVSLRTVEARRARVLHKLGVRTRAELVRVANRLGRDSDAPANDRSNYRPSNYELA
jgi:two-component system response regulator NreC